MATQMLLRLFWREIAWPPASFLAQTTKENKDENGKRKLFLYPSLNFIRLLRVVITPSLLRGENYSKQWDEFQAICICVVWSIKLRLIVISTRERQRKRESRRQASETEREKRRQRARSRDKNQRRHFLLEEKHKNLVAAVRKWEMLAATNVKKSGSEKKQWTRTRTTVPP